MMTVKQFEAFIEKHKDWDAIKIARAARIFLRKTTA